MRSFHFQDPTSVQLTMDLIGKILISSAVTWAAIVAIIYFLCDCQFIWHILSEASHRVYPTKAIQPMEYQPQCDSILNIRPQHVVAFHRPRVCRSHYRPTAK